MDVKLCSPFRLIGALTAVNNIEKFERSYQEIYFPEWLTFQLFPHWLVSKMTVIEVTLVVIWLSIVYNWIIISVDYCFVIFWKGRIAEFWKFNLDNSWYLYHNEWWYLNHILLKLPINDDLVYFCIIKIFFCEIESFSNLEFQRDTLEKGRIKVSLNDSLSFCGTKLYHFISSIAIILCSYGSTLVFA